MAKSVRVAFRQILCEETKGLCYWCGRPCCTNPRSGYAHREDILTIDHVIPRSRGGPDTIENLVGACMKCNNLREHIETYLKRQKPLPPEWNIDKLMPLKEFKKYPVNGQEMIYG